MFLLSNLFEIYDKKFLDTSSIGKQNLDLRKWPREAQQSNKEITVKAVEKGNGIKTEGTNYIAEK
jgi:hypothetical protein